MAAEWGGIGKAKEMTQSNKAIAIGVAVGIVIAVLLVSVIIPEIKQAILRHQTEDQEERAYEEVLSCSVNMNALILIQCAYIGCYGYPSDSQSELITFGREMGFSESALDISCPRGSRDYEITVIDGEYVITCSYGHGSMAGPFRESLGQ